jgi:hypothetical protein
MAATQTGIVADIDAGAGYDEPVKEEEKEKDKKDPLFFSTKTGEIRSGGKPLTRARA